MGGGQPLGLDAGFRRLSRVRREREFLGAVEPEPRRNAAERPQWRWAVFRTDRAVMDGFVILRHGSVVGGRGRCFLRTRCEDLQAVLPCLLINRQDKLAEVGPTQYLGVTCEPCLDLLVGPEMQTQADVETEVPVNVCLCGKLPQAQDKIRERRNVPLGLLNGLFNVCPTVWPSEWLLSS